MECVITLPLLTFIPTFDVQGCILDDERVRTYAIVAEKGSAVRFAFAAAIFGDFMEALFWLQLPNALNHLISRLVNKSPPKATQSASTGELDEASMLNRISSRGKSLPKDGNESLLVSLTVKKGKFSTLKQFTSAYP